MKKVLIIIAVAGSVLLIKFTLFSKKQEAPPSKGPGAVPAATVTAFVVHQAKLSNDVLATGSLLANEEVVLSPEVPGKITQLNFKEGQQVSKGQLLVKLNDNDLQAQKRKLELQKKLATERSDRLRQLVSINATSREEADIAISLVQEIQADIDNLDAQIRKTEIRAPFNGTIGLRSVSDGAFVATGARIAILQQMNPLKLEFSLPEQYFSLLRADVQVEFTFQGSNAVFKGKTYAIEPQIDASTRSVRVRALVENAGNKALPGTFVQVKIPLEETPDALMIPTESIIPILKGQKVFVSRNGKAKEVQVRTGLRNDARIQVLEGLQEGDTVITTGIMSLKNGVPLKITKITNDAAKEDKGR